MENDTTFPDSTFVDVKRSEVLGDKINSDYQYARRETLKLIEMSKTNAQPFSLMLIEMDAFQNLSELYGNKLISEIVRMIGSKLNEGLSKPYLLAHFSDRSFIMILPGKPLENSLEIAEQLRQKVERIDFSAIDFSQKVSVSIGVTQYPSHGLNFDNLLKQTEEVLSDAKQRGGNRVKSPAKAVVKKSWLSTRVVLLMVALIIVAGATALYFQKNPQDNQILTFSGLVESNEINVGSKIGGLVKEVMVKPSQMVKMGQPLVKFDVSDLLAQRKILLARIAQQEAVIAKLENGNRKEEIEQAEAIVGQEKANLAALKSGSRPQEILQKKAQLEALQQGFVKAESYFNSTKTLYANGLVSKQIYDSAEADMKIANAQVKALGHELSLLETGPKLEEIDAAQERYHHANAQLKLLQAGFRPEDLLEARARLSEANATLEQLNLQIAQQEIVAPVDSFVELIMVRPGDILSAGSPTAKLLEEDQLWVKIFVPETLIASIRPNQPVDIFVDTFPNKKFVGYISEIANQGEFTPRNIQTLKGRSYQAFGVKIHVDNKEHLFKPGMAADIKMDTTQFK